MLNDFNQLIDGDGNIGDHSHTNENEADMSIEGTTLIFNMNLLRTGIIFYFLIINIVIFYFQ